MLKTLKNVKEVTDVLTDPVKVVVTTVFLSILRQQQQQQKKKKAELSFGRIFEQTEVIGIYSWFSDCFTPLYHLQWLHPIE